ncbi:MAG: transglutaminase-like domain-containing protein [Coriobacteriales bacterium]|jgi:transglutaminase-like putative cysteine protease|nr:transglutaminase-like domain-containing protein [Coriobacteriales bacterium]
MLAVVCMAMLLLASCSGQASSGSQTSGAPRDNAPVVLAVEQPGSATTGDENAILDYSNASEGYVCAASRLDDTLVKVLVDAPDGTQYQYSIKQEDSYITIPLSAGSGTYLMGVYEHVTGETYAALFSQEISVEIADENRPFLYPNQYVDFAAGDQSVQLGQQVTDGAFTEVDAADDIYMWVVENISYDYDKAAEVQPGYLPNNDDTLAAGKGICFDFASLTASMMRSQRLPTKLEIGYAGEAYHAWIEVYTADQGTIRREIEFVGNSWVRLDPTFDSAGRGTGSITQIIGDGSSYQTMFSY